MRTLPSRLLGLLLSALLLVLADRAPACQDDPRLAATNRYRAYLERNPYHADVFEDLYEAAVIAGALDALRELYSERLASDPADESARVVLVRLEARSGRVERAEELARELLRGGVETLLLLAQLSEHAGRPARAAELYERAFDAAPGLDERRDVLRGLADAKLLTDDLSGARVAYLRLAELEPESYAARQETADFLARAGLHADATRQYTEAARLAGNDAARRCQALAALGAAHEALHEGDAALAAYEEALALLGRGHWLQRDLLERVLALHDTAGTLDTWIARCARDAAADDARAADHELWAQALARARRPTEALDALRAGLERFPADVPLSDALLAGAAARGDHARRIAELERRLAQAPDDPALLLGLGDAHAAAGDLSQAERAWTSTLADADTRRLRALAARWRAAGDAGRARAYLEQALALDPGDAASARELYELLRDNADLDAAAAHLEALVERAAGRAQELADVAELFVARDGPGDRERACALLREASRLRPGALAPHARLAELHALDGDTLARRAALRTIIRLAGDAPQRTEALALLDQSLVTDESRAAWVERERAARGGDDQTPYLVLAQLHARDDPDKAIVRFRDFLGVTGGEDQEARRALIDALLRARRHAEALSELDVLAAREPRERSAALLRKANVLQTLGRDEDALAALATVRRDAKSSPVLLVQLADRYEAMRRDDLALEALEHALRLDPDDTDIARALGHVYSRADHPSKARRRLLEAWRHADDAEQREDILGEIWALYAHAADRERELETLQRRAEENPYDREAPRLLIEFLLLAEDHARAMELADLMLRRRPDDARYLRARGRAHFLARDLTQAARDVRRLCALGQPPDALIADMIPVLIERLGDRGLDEALALGRLARDPARVGRALMVAGHYRRAADFLREYAEEQGLSNEELIELLTELRDFLEDFPDFAIQVFEAAELRLGPSLDRAVRLGNLYHRVGRPERALECGKRMLELGADDQQLESYFRGIGDFEALSTIRAGEAFRLRTSADALRVALTDFLENRYAAPAALKLLGDLARLADVDGERPAGLGPREWRFELAGWERSFLLRNPAQRDVRLTSLLERVASGAELDAASWAQLLWLCKPQARDVRGEHEPLARALVAEAALVELLARHPESPELLALLADWAQRGGRRRQAIELYRRLLLRYADDPELVAFDAARTARAVAAHRARVTAALPEAMREKVRDQLELVAALHRVGRASGPRRVDAIPSRDDVRRQLVRCLARTGQPDAARAVLAELQPGPTDVEALLAYAALCSVSRLGPELAATLGALHELAFERFEPHPRIRDAGNWHGDLRADLEQAARWCVTRRLFLIE